MADEADTSADEWKRSRSVNLVLVASCGAAAYGLAKLGPKTEDVRVYRDPMECAAARLRSEDDCRNDWLTARQLYPEVAPRHASKEQCEARFDLGRCVQMSDLTPPGMAGQFIPVMSGYVIGASVAQAVPAQPVFQLNCMNAPAAAPQYVTASNALIVMPGTHYSTAAWASSSDLRADPSTLRRVDFGGFGAAARECLVTTGGGG